MRHGAVSRQREHQGNRCFLPLSPSVKRASPEIGFKLQYFIKFDVTPGSVMHIFKITTTPWGIVYTSRMRSTYPHLCKDSVQVRTEAEHGSGGRIASRRPPSTPTGSNERRSGDRWALRPPRYLIMLNLITAMPVCLTARAIFQGAALGCRLALVALPLAAISGE